MANHPDPHARNRRQAEVRRSALRLCGLRPEPPRPVLEADVAEAMARAPNPPRRPSSADFIPSPGGRRD